MSNQDQVESKQVEASAPEAPSKMRMLTTAELLEVVGGPIIDNGIGIAPASATSNNG